jgi:hypothetical protein
MANLSITNSHNMGITLLLILQEISPWVCRVAVRVLIWQPSNNRSPLVTISGTLKWPSHPKCIWTTTAWVSLTFSLRSPLLSLLFLTVVGMAQGGVYPQMAYGQGEMAYTQTTPDGMTYMAYPQQAVPGYWPQAQAGLMDPSQQNMMFYGQHSPADFTGMTH